MRRRREVCLKMGLEELLRLRLGTREGSGLTSAMIGIAGGQLCQGRLVVEDSKVEIGDGLSSISSVVMRRASS